MRSKHNKEKKEFISRMLGKVSAKDYPKQMKFTNEIFKHFDGELDFLSKVKKPHFIHARNYGWLTGKEGKEYLDKKFMEYSWEIDNDSDKFVDYKEKRGEDVEVNRRKNTRSFIDT